MKNFQKQFWTRFQDYKEATALYEIDDDGRRSVSYWKWTRRIQNLAMGLMDAGFEKGTRMGMVAPNCRDWLDMAMATWLVGGCVVPLVAGRERQDTLRCLGRTGCDWIAVADTNERNRLRGPGGQMPDHIQWAVFDEEAEATEDLHPIGDLEETGRSLVQRGYTRQIAERIYDVDARAPALVLFEPEPGEDAEGALFSGQSVARMLDAIASQADISGDGDAVVAPALSFGWFSSFLMTVSALYAGKSVAVASRLSALSEEVQSLKPTHLVCGPAYLEQLAEQWQKRLDAAPDILKKLADADGDRSALSSALGSLGERAARKFLYDPIGEDFGGQLEVIQVFEGRCPVGLHPILDGAGIALLGHFGIAEAGITHIEHPQARRPDSCGRPIEGIATKIAGAKTGESGELLLRGDTVFDEYWTGQGPREVDDDGWIHTGRRARLESGYLFLEDGK